MFVKIILAPLVRDREETLMRFRHFMIVLAAIILISILVKREEDKITKKLRLALRYLPEQRLFIRSSAG